MDDQLCVIRRADLEADPAGVEGDREAEELAAVLLGCNLQVGSKVKRGFLAVMMAACTPSPTA